MSEWSHRRCTLLYISGGRSEPCSISFSVPSLPTHRSLQPCPSAPGRQRKGGPKRVVSAGRKKRHNKPSFVGRRSKGSAERGRTEFDSARRGGRAEDGPLLGTERGRGATQRRGYTAAHAGGDIPASRSASAALFPEPERRPDLVAVAPTVSVLIRLWTRHGVHAALGLVLV